VAIINTVRYYCAKRAFRRLLLPVLNTAHRNRSVVTELQHTSVRGPAKTLVLAEHTYSTAHSTAATCSSCMRLNAAVRAVPQDFNSGSVTILVAAQASDSSSLQKFEQDVNSHQQNSRNRSGVDRYHHE
jgi:hypothetical protein